MRSVRALVFLAFLLAGCAQVASTEATVCADIAKIPPTAAAVLDAQDPHSALGDLWASAKSACAAGAPVAGVSTSWSGMIWGELKVLIPQVLPTVLPLLVGLL